MCSRTLPPLTKNPFALSRCPLIETLPGFYLGGNLYRPRKGKAKHPGILNPQGHWPYGRLENEPLYSGPSLGISLARQGYVVFAYDMVGYTDTIQLPHRFGSSEQRLWSFGPLGLQLVVAKQPANDRNVRHVGNAAIDPQLALGNQATQDDRLATRVLEDAPSRSLPVL
jgi:fermentation-respiration switch protein FrsA (DUF1100 family)